MGLVAIREGATCAGKERAHEQENDEVEGYCIQLIEQLFRAIEVKLDVIYKFNEQSTSRLLADFPEPVELSVFCVRRNQEPPTSSSILASAISCSLPLPLAIFWASCI